MKYDIVLIVEYFRSINYYLSIIKYLKNKYSIAILPVQRNSYDANKNFKSQNNFIKLCIELGASIVHKNQECETNILIIPQRPFDFESISEIRKIKAKLLIGFLSFAWAGIPLHDNFMKMFEFDKIYAIDKNFIKFLIDNRGVHENYRNVEIVEVGLPYKKYPVFEEFKTDYLLAMPTAFSFPEEKDKQIFLETIEQLFKELNHDDIIVHKQHNALEVDQFSSRKIRIIASFISIFLKKSVWVKSLSTIRNKRLNNFFSKIYTSFLYLRILKRTVPMKKKTAYSNFSLEAFLPGVKKGVIGGLSNTIWGSLYNEIPFYNCVNIEKQNRNAEEKLYGKKSSAIMELNLKYFFVPFCNGKKSFDESCFNIISESTRSADLIKEIDRELTRIENEN